MKEPVIYKYIPVVLSLSNLLLTALGITDCLGDIYSIFSCISEIRHPQQRLMLS
jgi:hypothetical protein